MEIKRPPKQKHAESVYSELAVYQGSQRPSSLAFCRGSKAAEEWKSFRVKRGKTAGMFWSEVAGMGKLEGG